MLKCFCSNYSIESSLNLVKSKKKNTALLEPNITEGIQVSDISKTDLELMNYNLVCQHAYCLNGKRKDISFGGGGTESSFSENTLKTKRCMFQRNVWRDSFNEISL